MFSELTPPERGLPPDRGLPTTMGWVRPSTDCEPPACKIRAATNRPHTDWPPFTVTTYHHDCPHLPTILGMGKTNMVKIFATPNCPQTDWPPFTILTDRHEKTVEGVSSMQDFEVVKPRSRLSRASPSALASMGPGTPSRNGELRYACFARQIGTEPLKHHLHPFHVNYPHVNKIEILEKNKIPRSFIKI